MAWTPRTDVDGTDFRRCRRPHEVHTDHAWTTKAGRTYHCDMVWWEPETFSFSISSPRLDPVAGLKAVACYEYQSCEHPEWQGSSARRFCEALRRELIARLPGYDAAPWEVRA